MVYGFKYAVVFGTQMTFILTGYTVGYTCINAINSSDLDIRLPKIES